MCSFKFDSPKGESVEAILDVVVSEQIEKVISDFKDLEQLPPSRQRDQCIHLESGAKVVNV